MARPTSPKTVVSRLFSASQRPIYLLDASKRIVFCNAALAEWLGVDEQTLLGMKCSYSVPSNDDVSSRLGIPPQARDSSFVEATITVGEGPDASHRSAVFLTMRDQVDIETTLVVVDEFDADQLQETPFDSSSLHRQLLLLRSEWGRPYSWDHLVGQSLAMRQVRTQAELATKSPCRVVVVGNEGTGREQLARTIHQERTQGTQSLVPLSCNLLDAELLQATIEDFIRQGAELADEELGTLLLLEVDQLPIEAQASLLGFLEIPELGLKTIATCRKPLLQLVEQKSFRLEIAQHLTELEIRLPSLNDRLDDIPLLAQWVLERSSHCDRVGGFTAETIEALLRYPWPREVAELKEVIEEAASNASSSLIAKDDLPKKFQYAADAEALPDVKEEQISLDDFLAEVESELIQRAIGQAKGNRAQAARLLNVSRGKLLRRIEQLGIEVE